MTQKCPLSANFLPLGSAMQNLGLALMAGGMLALGAFTAPVVFGNFSREEAGPVMAMIFRRYDVLLMIALGLVLLGEWLRHCSRQIAVKTPVALVRYALMAALSLSLIYSTQVVNANIEHLNKAGVQRSFLTDEGRQFEKTHKLSEALYKADVLMAVLLLLLTPFVNGRANASHSGAESGASYPHA